MLCHCSLIGWHNMITWLNVTYKCHAKALQGYVMTRLRWRSVDGFLVTWQKE